ncbi:MULTISPECIES: DNA alkylation repair protein [unclassified Microbacterium]|uniref:DNA alkylation repair protein n=1 Tax=unclassified Microbacterium TaxID=2609290 RepID=UPI000CFB4BE6|nr:MULTISPECIES: DNA alkylation repair protein [unclassified Microbacterium]PQZ54112.1 DNA alkylation repair protein [Microbacterium sp. MYb43]PQZ81593.1 DNA alkylation repair protein [Microbacterium sp. MYb40]PRB17453.1 DNA alkylation repair protein [Microbacterium sp. MYb54]PRB30140.1 DNA alkylation repair protein [Microbacterium sp. MYb50]PRB64166.1 DNA alkylation repair protein [Microbacterium sp. MYb24]
MTAADLVQSIRSALRDEADPELAPAQQAYMKSALPFLGVRVPRVRAVTRGLAREVTAAAVLCGTALVLWREAAYREERYAASALMALRPVRARLDMLDVHEEMIRTGAWWDHVDEVSHRLAETLDAHPAEMAPLLRAWSRDDDFWVRRASIISQLGRKDATDRELLTAVIEPNLADAEFFVRKAIGWALRELGKTDPAWVRAFVESHELSPLSRREALKLL